MHKSRRVILKIILATTGSCLVGRSVASSKPKESDPMGSAELTYLKREWTNKFDVTPIQYLQARHINSSSFDKQAQFINDDLRYRRVHFVDGFTLSEYEFALLASKQA